MITHKCPKCGNEARRKLSGMGVRHDCCGLWSINEAPLADYATHAARKTARTAFDLLAKRVGGHAKAYEVMSARFNSGFDCIPEHMIKSNADRVPRIVADYCANLKREAEAATCN